MYIYDQHITYNSYIFYQIYHNYLYVIRNFLWLLKRYHHTQWQESTNKHTWLQVGFFEWMIQCICCIYLTHNYKNPIGNILITSHMHATSNERCNWSHMTTLPAIRHSTSLRLILSPDMVAVAEPSRSDVGEISLRRNDSGTVRIVPNRKRYYIAMSQKKT